MGLFDLFKSESIVDETALSNVTYTINLIHEFKKLDEENFTAFQIFGLNDNDDVVVFKNATQLFFKILYTGSSVPYIFEEMANNKEYINYTSLFGMFKEDNGDYSFCCKWSLKNSNAIEILNLAFSETGIKKEPHSNEKGIYIPII